MALSEDKLPPLPWAANGGALTWTLLTCLQEKENFSVLFGKQDPKDISRIPPNTSSDRKITVYERIAQKMFPEDFKTHAKMLGRRVCKIYKEKAAHLRVTGGGIGAPEDSGADGGHQYLDYYIPADGPHHDTSVAAVNLVSAGVNCPLTGFEITADCSTEGANQNFQFWDIFKEFPISQPILHRFTWKLDRSTRLIQPQLVIERNL
ncbi:hypothetical protein DFH09DRAFT_1084424 [Mycena vulgaris]|nr:hypothetical protein DFH09DRAFT_1084424 [Mycena vulgaris]